MDTLTRLDAMESIKQAKARYFRGVDTRDSALVRSILTTDCVLDYNGCCTDPFTGIDHMPAFNRILNGAASFGDGGAASDGFVSIHHGHDCDINVFDDTTADAIFAMSDQLFFASGRPFNRLDGAGFYHERYRVEDGIWKIATLRLERLRVSVSWRHRRNVKRCARH